MQNNDFNINDDDFIIGKGFNVEQAQPNGRKKSKGGKSSAVKNIIWIICIIVVSVTLAVGCIYAGADYLGLGFGRGEVKQMDIPMGSSTIAIAEKLADEEIGAVKIPLLFRLYSKLKGYESQYKYGLYTFNNEAGYEEIANMLMNDGAKADSVRVTIPEGTGINDYVHIVNGKEETIKGIATILEEKGVCSKSDFIYALNEVTLDTKLLQNCNEGKTYYTLEGYLFPDTYDFYSYDSKECAQMVVEKMVKQAESKITDEMYKRAEEMGYSMNEILTMASIIQMESGIGVESMPDVAAVFYNRLNSKDFSTLGSSPTCYYGYSFKNDDERYDTYKIKGIPPGPLCSPGLDAIKAALYPSTDMDGMFYFVTDADGNFYFNKTEAEHNKTIAKLKQENKWVNETFR